jgi:serine protease AprX
LRSAQRAEKEKEMTKQEAFAPAESRSSALWGTGNRGGGQRSSALWGKGGRPFVTLAVAALALTLPVVATAARAGKGGPKPDGKGTYVPQALLDKAHKNPSGKLRVIVQSNQGRSGAENAFKGLGAGNLGRRLDLVGAVSIEIPASKLDKLASIPGLTVTPDAVVKVSALPAGVGAPVSGQLWPYEAAFGQLWASDERYAANMPTIAIVDSGVEPGRADFGSRLLASVNMSSLPNNSPGDGRGHGTFVAGVAGGSAYGYAGGAPKSNLVSIDVMDDNGVARTSDVIAACQWILDNKGKYNIRVANFSLHSGMPSNFTVDPLDRAVEKLWFNGVTVVAAAGNYGTSNTTPSGVLYAPGNDPFVITVGAIDLGGTARDKDDFAAPWSAWGRTYDGFMKPDVAAPGRFMIGPVPALSSLVKQKADHVVATGYIQLSGTSFASPVVAAAAAEILSRHPEYKPDQIKGALMVSARKITNGAMDSAGAGEIVAARAATLRVSPPNPNAALNGFLVSDGSGGLRFDGTAWQAASYSDASWDTASYADASWSDASWDVASYADASWDAASYADASYANVSYADASYADASYEDAAEGDATSDTSLGVSPLDMLEILNDPLLAPPVAPLPDPTP